ncbi:hypothetical protein A0O36_02254 [Piscirickettsiaceae bacterium NZ-RLO1]|nr:hypothetical protein A0O36_02254 [Piscirickettsiaceae bacterium NZ-RLO1]
MGVRPPRYFKEIRSTHKRTKWLPKTDDGQHIFWLLSGCANQGSVCKSSSKNHITIINKYEKIRDWTKPIILSWVL